MPGQQPREMLNQWILKLQINETIKKLGSVTITLTIKYCIQNY